MSTQAITSNRQFEVVTKREMDQVAHIISQQFRYRGVEEAVEYLRKQPGGSAVRLKVMADRRLKRMRESAIGYATRRGFMVHTRHLAGWLYLVKGSE